MDRKEIEEKDQDLLKDIRQIVRRNEEKPKKNKSFFQSMRFWLPALAVVAIIAGTMVFNKTPTTSTPDSPEQVSGEVVYEKELAADENTTDLKITYDSEDRAPAKDSADEAESSDSEKIVQPEKEPSSQMAASTSPESVEEEPVATTESVPTEEEAPTSVATSASPESQVKEDAGTEATAAALPKTVEETGDSPSINIAKLISCEGVQDRQFVSPQSVFSLKKVSKPVVWMTVLTDKPPFTLTHVYYHNDKKYCEVPLEIKYPRMRTWSRLTLTQEYQTGRYRVEVVTDDGEILGETEYTVVP